MYHSRKIGVFLSHIFGDYQQKLCQGIFDTAGEYGYLVEVFTSTDGENPGTLTGEMSILQIPSCQDFDGIIFADSTYLEPKLADSIQEHISRICSCPVVYVDQDGRLANHVVLDNSSPFAALTEHFITVHGHKRICYLGCKSEPAISQERLSYYQHTLKKHQLPVQEENIYAGNYGTEAAGLALAYFCKHSVPDAILCYNDRMALDLMLAASRAGYVIPQDIAIAGCDDLEISKNITPTLTTITFPVYEAGCAALHKLVALIDDTDDGKAHKICAQPLIGCSCGCQYRTCTNPYYAIHQMHEIARKERRIYQDIRMSEALHEVTNLEEGMELLFQYIPEIRHCSELYLCLYDGWDSAPKHIRLLTGLPTIPVQELMEEPAEDSYDEHTVHLVLGFCKGQQISPRSFVHQDILPSYLLKKSDSHYLCEPLYFEEKAFGYLVLAFEENRIRYDFHVTSWKDNVARMLKRIADNRHMMMLAGKLEDIYLRDELTGLYNVRGLHSMSDMLLSDAIDCGASVFAASIDIRHLKEINHLYGHPEGNFALQVVAGALNTSADSNAVIARTGGDEFCILAAGFDKEDARSYLDHVSRYLEHYNRLQSKPYTIEISIGHALSPVSNAAELDALIRSADLAMYQDKEAH